MAFRSPVGVWRAGSIAADNPQPIPLPDDYQVGEWVRIQIGINEGGTMSLPSGWTWLVNNDLFDSSATAAVIVREMDGTEGTTVNITLSTSRHVSYITGRIEAGPAPEVATPTNGAGNAADPPSLTYSGGSGEHLWIAGCIIDRGLDGSVSGVPTDYTLLEDVDAAEEAQGCCPQAVAYDQVATATENPDAFSNTSRAWSAITEVYPEAAAAQSPVSSILQQHG